MDNANNHSAVSVMHHLLVGALAVAATVGATNAMAATDMFLQVGDIAGESADDKHPNEIQVLAWSWGVGGSMAGGPQKGGAKPACAQLLSVDKYVDKATPLLVANAALNTTIPTARFTVRKRGEHPIEFLVVNLTGVTVKALTSGGSTEDDRMTENLTLGFASGTITYTLQSPDGRPGTSVSGSTLGSCP